MATKKANPTWIDVEATLADFDRSGLYALVQGLYAASKEARMHLGNEALNPKKTRFDRQLWPDVFKNQDNSVANAKKATADYEKAPGTSKGLVELQVFYCEHASGFSRDVGLQDKATSAPWRKCSARL